MIFTSGDVIAIIALNVTVLIAVIAGILRQESRMTKQETLLERMSEQYDSHDRRITELEKVVWRRETK